MIKTVVDLVNSFKKIQDTAIIHNGRKISYKKFYDDIAYMAFVINERIAKSEINVIISSKNKYKFLVGIYSVMYSGRTAVPVAPDTSLEGFKYIMNKCKSKWMLYDQTDNIVFPEIRNIPIGSGKIVSAEYKHSQIMENDNALILFTSGTTGHKKGVILSHANLIKTSLYINKFMDIHQKPVEYLMIPLYHSFGFARSRCIFLAGGTIVLDDGFFNPLLMQKRLVSFSCNAFSGVPAVISMLLKTAKFKFNRFGGQIFYVEIGSAPMPEQEKLFLISNLPNARICMHYGLTEASRSCFIEFHSEKDKLDSVGKPSPGVELDIVDETGQSCKPGEIGLIKVKGPNVAKGYLSHKEGARSGFENGWFITSDIGEKDGEGYIYFRGRNDDVINVGGEKISALVLESKIEESGLHPEDFCVIGVPDEDGIFGEVPLLCTTDREFDKNKHQRLIDDLQKRRVKHSFIPKSFHYLEKLPKTHNGKIKRKLVSEMLIVG